MQHFQKSNKLEGVCYDIRGPVLDEANRMEDDGHRILKLNIGNPAPFGFNAPDEILHDVIHNLPAAQGYSHSKGIFAARKAIMQRTQVQGIPHVEVDDIFLGNGASELIVFAMQALLNDGDEILIPAPDYPLWTAAVRLAGGKPIHYICDESNDWQPDLEDINRKITDRTRGIVVINPNNPTGAVYSEDVLRGIVEACRRHDLVVFADEIYDRIVFDGTEHTPLGRLATDILCVTLNGLSKTYRLAGFRSGWLIVSGAKHRARSYIQGIEMLCSMRLCANVPAMFAIQTALGGYQSINDLICPGGRLYEQREKAHTLLTAIPGVSCFKPKGALYMFPKLDPEIYPIADDEQFCLDLLLQEKMLVANGSAFNLDDTQHFRIVFLPWEEDLVDAIGRIDNFLSSYRTVGKAKAG